MATVEGFPRPAGSPLDLEVRRGEVVLLTGPNGSGKTSLLRALAGLPSPMAPRAAHASANVQMLTQDPRDGLVGLTVAGEFRLRRLNEPALGRLDEQEVATLSSGEARRVAFEVARQARPDLLLLDEPAEGLDDHALALLLAAVHAAAARGCAILAADHSGTLEEVATRRIAVAPERQVQVDSIPRKAGPVVVAAPAAKLELGAPGTSHAIALPAVQLCPGFHILAGPNGSGKSTMLARLAGLANDDGVLVNGKPPRPGATTRLLLPRARDLFVRATVEEELLETQGAAGRLVPKGLLARHPLTLSGGEAQRVALAKTLGQPAPVVLLDEPEAHLDSEAWPLLRDAIAQRVSEGACVLAATHDRRLTGLAHSILRLEIP